MEKIYSNYIQKILSIRIPFLLFEKYSTTKGSQNIKIMKMAFEVKIMKIPINPKFNKRH